MAETFTSASGSVEIKSEERGPHWVAWIVGRDGKPRDSVLLVGQTREEAEARARARAVIAAQG